MAPSPKKGSEQRIGIGCDSKQWIQMLYSRKAKDAVTYKKEKIDALRTS